MINDIKYNVWIIRMLIIAGLGCSVVYSTQLFDGIKTAKTFYFIIALCLMLFFLSLRILWRKENITFSLSIPDLLLGLYAAWAVVRLFTSDTDSFHNLYFWESSACMLWYCCLRSFFCNYSEKKFGNYFAFFFIALGYIQLIFCTLQLTGIAPSFSPIFPVSGTFDNTSELCIYLTCILPMTVYVGLKASDTTRIGMTVRAVCLIYALCWLMLVLTMGSRTALLSGLIGMAVYGATQIGLFGHLKRKINTLVRKILIVAVLLFMVGGLTFVLSQYKKDSANGRLLIWKVAWSGIREVPLQGQGFNAFQAKYGHYQAAYFKQYDDNQEEIKIADNMTVAMNDYIETAFNLGFIGLLLFAAFWLSLFKGVNFGNSLHLVAIAVIVIFLVSSGFYFVDKMLSVKVIVLFFAAYLGSIPKNIVDVHIRPFLMKSIAVLLMIICCFFGYAAVNKTRHYTQWRKAEILIRFGHIEEAQAEYEKIYSCMQYNGLFLYFFAKNLFENKAYQRSLKNLEKAKSQVTGSGFYTLFGDVCFQNGDYENAIKHYEYAAYIVPNRFRPLYKLFKLYEETGNVQKALEMAWEILNKPIKIDSNEIQQIKKDCIDYINLKNYEQKNSVY